MRRDLFVATAFLLLGCVGIYLYYYAFELHFIWQRDLMLFCSFLIVYGELAWMLYKVDKRNWLWLALCGFCVLMMPVFSVVEAPFYLFWLPCLISCLIVYAYFVNRQMAKILIFLSVAGVISIFFVVWLFFQMGMNFGG